MVTACMLAACSSSGKVASGSHGRSSGSPPLSLPGGPGRFVVVGPGGPGGGILVVPGPSGSSGRPKITVPAIPSASSSQPINLPLTAYVDVATLQQAALSDATTLLTQKCMAARGFDYSAETTPAEDQAVVQATEYGYGVSSVTDAATYGYGQPSSNSDSGGGPAIAALGGFASFGDLASQPRAWTVALLGFAPGALIGRSPEEGCLQQVNTLLYDRGAVLADPVPAIAVQASQWTQTDPRILAMDAAWSRCMAQRGYKYGNPQQPAEHNWPRAPTSQEIATAVADVTCKQQVDYVNTWLTIEAAYQAALVGTELATLSNLQASFARMLKRAETLLAAPVLPGAGLLTPRRLGGSASITVIGPG
jgi:hypothetical protein